ncbi:uncharacterized protein I206_103457 [Kwoniella pini CBS 10737]|uniref:Uncharacterized protein n=1 Tax=Kwoniella pini CBS 10737 TaxID=1296096 RepID=A0A1B9I9Y4_9TREE|nr:uncharacterized protein I206_01540 [Kwoniella pini CBS 10737]OCF52254.1 hypothetical protein I206_01540 [Kwoniella pini CBS 10737]
MRCAVRPDLAAEWWCESHGIRLSSLVAAILISSGHIKSSSLTPARPAEYGTTRRAYDPMTGTIDAALDITQDLGEGLVNLVTKPQKGLTTISAFPFVGASKILDGFSTGLHNLPRLYGYDVRVKGQVKDVRSGFAEGGKAFAYGLYDGITGIVTTPVKAAQDAKAKGTSSQSTAIAKGVAQGIMNAWSLPLAGANSLISDSVKGMVASCSDDGSNITQIEATKLYHGVKALESASHAERNYIISQFEHVSEEKRMKRGTMGKRIWHSLNRTRKVA